VSSGFCRGAVGSLGLPAWRFAEFLQSVKGPGTRDCGTCSASIGEVCVGWTRRSTQVGVRGRHLHIRLDRPDSWAVAEQRVGQGRRVHLQDFRILTSGSECLDWMIGVDIGIELRPRVMNRYGGLYLSLS